MVDNFSKVLTERTKHAFPAIKSRSMKLCCFISRIQELNAYLEDFLTDTEGQETEPLPADEVMDIIYHSMPAI